MNTLLTLFDTPRMCADFWSSRSKLAPCRRTTSIMIFGSQMLRPPP